jgi:hypothetical protein
MVESFENEFDNKYTCRGVQQQPHIRVMVGHVGRHLLKRKVVEWWRQKTSTFSQALAVFGAPSQSM